VSTAWKAFVYAAAAFGTSATQPAAAQNTATDVTKAEIEAVRTYQGRVVTDRQVKVVDVGEYNIGVGILHRGHLQEGERIGGLVHNAVTEVYYVLSGSGTLITGGVLADARVIADDGDAVQVLVGPSDAGFVEGGDRRIVSAGDVVIIPAGTPHAFAEITDHVDYLSIRPDTNDTLPAGYVHPALKR